MNLKNTQKNSCRGDEIKMSKYKIGDKVYLEGKISEYDENDNTYHVDYSVYCERSQTSCWIKEEVLHTTDDDYNKGLNDAWELAKNIVTNSDDGGYTAKELGEMFRTILPSEVFADFTPQEALAKAKAYEEEHIRIRVGDVVKLKGTSHEAVVTWVTETTMCLLFRDGSCGSHINKKNFEKTGKHFDIIDEFMGS